MKEEYERYLTVEKNINKGRNNEHAVRDLNSGSGDGDILIIETKTIKIKYRAPGWEGGGVEYT